MIIFQWGSNLQQIFLIPVSANLDFAKNYKRNYSFLQRARCQLIIVTAKQYPISKLHVNTLLYHRYSSYFVKRGYGDN